MAKVPSAYVSTPTRTAGGTGTPSERTIEDKIARLRARAKRLAQDNPASIVAVGILLGILDLLGDEL